MNHIHKRLLRLLSSLPEAAVAFSGGVDSSLVAHLAREALGARSLALTADTEFISRTALNRAMEKARKLGLAHRVCRTNLLDDPKLAAHPADRCYLCKRRILSLLAAHAQKGAVLLDGTLADDDPFRPGRAALRELCVRSPLAECGLGKKDVRALSKRLGLPGADDPSDSCLATRLPEGRPITSAALARVEAVEEELLRLGFTDIRARDMGETARLDIPAKQKPLFQTHVRRIEEAVRRAGFLRMEPGERP